MESIMDIMGLAWKGDSVERLSSQIHESHAATRKGLESAVPLSMAGLASLFSSEQKASELLGTFEGGDFPHIDASEVGSLVQDPDATSRLTQSSSGFLGRIFGNRLDGILDSLAGTSGVSRTSATTLLGIAAPLVLGAVQKESQARALDARGLSRFLSDEGQKASGLLPGNLSGLFGRTTVAEVVPSRARRVTYSERAFETHAYDTPAIAPPPLPREVRRVHEVVRAPEVAPEPVRRSSGLWWLLLPLALLGLFGLMRMGRREPSTVPRPVVTAPREAPVPAPTTLEQTPAATANERRAAPEGVEQAQAPAAVERPKVQEPAVPTPATGRTQTQQHAAATPRVAAPIASPEPVTEPSAAEPVRARLEPEVRVVHFTTNSHDPLNRQVLRQVVARMKQHPDASVRLRGFADPRGDKVMNQDLSEARAASVRQYLISHGIDAERIEMVGRGTQEQLDTHADSRRVELIIER